MLPQLLQQAVMLPETAHDIQGQILFPGRETGKKPISFPSAVVHIVIAPEANDAAPPHPGFRAGRLSHQVHDRETIPATVRIFDALQEFRYACLVDSCFEFRHLSS